MTTSSWRKSWRLRVVAHTPTVLLESQFEVLMAVFCLAIGPLSAAAYVRPTSLAALLPPLLVQGFGVALTLAGISIALGLRGGSPSWPVTTGLRLLGISVLAYATAVVGANGWPAAATGMLFFVIALLCFARSFVITTNLIEREIIAKTAIKS